MCKIKQKRNEYTTKSRKETQVEKNRYSTPLHIPRARARVRARATTFFYCDAINWSRVSHLIGRLTATEQVSGADPCFLIRLDRCRDPRSLRVCVSDWLSSRHTETLVGRQEIPVIPLPMMSIASPSATTNILSTAFIFPFLSTFILHPIFHLLSQCYIFYSLPNA